MATQKQKAEALRALHRPGDPVVFVNAWDAFGARLLQQLGYPAVATTSAGISWREGFSDGERITREGMLQVVETIAKSVDIPVTADLEAGYGPSLDDAVTTARGAIAADAVGLNFEDWDIDKKRLFDAEPQCVRIAAIKEAGAESGVPLVINARTDVFLKKQGDDDAWRVAESVRRGNAYLEAGADCIFVPGVMDDALIEQLVKGIGGPVNVLAGPATSKVSRLAGLGVARISVGASTTAYVMTQFRDLAAEVKNEGTFTFTGRRLTHAEIDALFS